MKLLSIVIPVYNVEKFLRKCLDSVIVPESELLKTPERDGYEYEIIAVNDGSTDSSPEILNEYREKYPRLLRIVTKENGGLGSARNAGIPAAEGKYIIFPDSDDWLSENAVEEILQLCRERDFDLCFFGFRALNEQGDVLETVAGANEKGPFTLDSNPEILLCRMNAWNKIYRRSLFTENGIAYPDRAWYEDVFTTPKLYTKAETMIAVDNVWYNYLLRKGSIMNNRNVQRNLEIIDAVDTMNTYYRENGLFEKFRDQLEYFTFYNELIAATVRINLIDPRSPAQDRLLDYFLAEFPNYHENPYVKKMSRKYKLLDKLITRRRHGAVHLLMKLNDLLRH